MRLLLAVFALAIPLQDGDEQQVDNVFFKVPKEWKRADKGDVRALVPEGVSKGRTAALVICLGQEPEVAFREWFDKAWEQVKKDTEVVTWKDVPARKGAAGLSGVYRASLMEEAHRREDWRTEYAPKGGMTFRKDGTFEDDGLLVAAGASWWRPRKYRTFQEAEDVPGRGKYRIAQNSLELVYEDGRKRRVNFALPQDAPREKTDGFVINTWKFARVK